MKWDGHEMARHDLANMIWANMKWPGMKWDIPLRETFLENLVTLKSKNRIFGG